MLTITDAVRTILFRSPIALEAMRGELLNLSAFAEKILPEVEKLTWKSVQKNTIVVALSRVATELAAVPALCPEVHIDELSMKAPLADITYERTAANLKRVQDLSSQLKLHHSQFLTSTQGINEITIIVSQERLEDVKKLMQLAPISEYTNLVGLTMRFSEQYLPQPNVIYALLSKLAYQRLNLYEIVSTYTELTVLVEEADLQTAVAAVNGSFNG